MAVDRISETRNAPKDADPQSPDQKVVTEVQSLDEAVKQTTDPAPSEDTGTSSVEPDVTVEVRLRSDFDNEGEPVVVSVANEPDLELVEGKSYPVSREHAAALLDTPAVEAAE